MKKIVFICLVMIFMLTELNAQSIEKFLDYNHRSCEADRARFYAQIVNTDSGWVRRDYFLPIKKIQSKGLYTDSACTVKNGLFSFFYPTGILESKGKYENNRKTGLWLSYHPDGFIKDSTVYDYGEKVSTSLQWYSNGYLSDSTTYSSDGTAVAVSWFDNGAVSSAGRLNAIHLYHGKWKFFHSNGKMSSEEVYDNGRLVSRNYFSEFGLPVTDTTDQSKPATFPGGVTAWLKYLEKHLYWPTRYQLINGDKAEIGVDFTIDEIGNLKEVFINTPFEPAFNEIVERALKDSPKWVPAISHNRKVAYHHKQTVGFVQRRG